MSEFGLLKRIARYIRYRELHSLIGTQIEVESWEALNKQLPLIISAVIPTTSIVKIKPIQLGAFLKYGILDIDLLVESSLLESDYRRGVHLLDEMGWLDKSDEFSDLLEDANQSLFMTLWEDIEEKEVYLKLFGQALHTSSTPPTDVDTTNMDKHTKAAFEKLLLLFTNGYTLPNTFEVVDAYLTNASSLKMWKNFYL